MTDITPLRGKSCANDVDKHVGARMRERRIMLGLTQQQMAELIGVTYHQTLKYEKGINRIAASRLYHIAQALGVDVGYFFDGLDDGTPAIENRATPNQRKILELARNFAGIQGSKQQDAVCALARSLSHA